jgi:hypothetical protein
MRPTVSRTSSRRCIARRLRGTGQSEPRRSPAAKVRRGGMRVHLRLSRVGTFGLDAAPDVDRLPRYGVYEAAQS